MVIFRDKKTGRFVSRSTWKRSKARGGTRYVRQHRSKLTKRQREIIEEAEKLEEKQEHFDEREEEEIAGGFDSP